MIDQYRQETDVIGRDVIITWEEAKPYENGSEGDLFNLKDYSDHAYIYAENKSFSALLKKAHQQLFHSLAFVNVCIKILVCIKNKM